jgi:hypothetical protein
MISTVRRRGGAGNALGFHPGGPGPAHELHHQYLLGFTSQALDGKVHPLTVRVKSSGLSVRAREH